MSATVSIFLDFNLPNATTWFYFSFLLAVALFFKFARVLSVRNWDVLTLFLLVPGLMLVQGARSAPTPLPHHPAVRVAAFIGQGSGALLPAAPAATGDAVVFAALSSNDPRLVPGRWLWIGYLWLLAGSAYLWCRCLFDLALVQRPALAPNLTFGGLAWLAMALLACLAAVAFRPTPEEPLVQRKVETVGPSQPVGPESATLAATRGSLEWSWWMERAQAVVCHLAVVLGLIVVGRRHFNDPAAGMAAATFYLMLPYTGMFIGQVHHVLPTALLIWAIAVYPWPALSGMLLGLATAMAYFPALLAPLWASFYWRRGHLRFLAAFMLVAGAALTAGLALWETGEIERRLLEAKSVAAWQPWKVPTTESFWVGVHPAYRLPVFIGYIAFWLMTPFWPAPKNLAQTIALSTALIVGIQFWYADQGGVYVLWYLPLLLLLVFRPNLADRRAPEINPDNDWLHRLRRALGQLTARLLRTPEAATK